jgi:hypothetical protein
MGFPKDKADSNGINKKFGNTIPADERSNKGPTAGTKTIGVIKGRLTMSKSSVSSLNTGVCTYRATRSTGKGD